MYYLVGIYLVGIAPTSDQLHTTNLGTWALEA